MSECKDNEELTNIVDAEDDDLGEKIREMKTGVVLFYATWCKHSKDALRILTELAREYGNLGFIRVSISVEESDGSRIIVAPKIKETLGIERYPQWAVFENGLKGAPILSEKNKQEQMDDVRDLLRKKLRIH